MAQASKIDFNAIVRRYQKDLYHWAYDLTGSHEDAEDLAQETFIKVHKAMHRFRGEAKWSTWIFRIARNTYLDRLKTAGHKMRVLEKPMTEPTTQLERQFAAGDANPEKRAQGGDIQRDLNAALGKLSNLQREIFVLRHYHGFKLREIGDILNRSEGTVKTSLFRAIQNLRQTLNHHIAPSTEVT